MKDEKYLTVMLHVFYANYFFYYEMLIRYAKYNIPVMEVNAVIELFYCCYTVNSPPTFPVFFQHLYTKRPAV